MTDYSKQYINGRWCDSTSAEFIEVTNPANDTVIATIPAGTVADAEAAVSAAKAAFEGWAATPADKRAAYMVAIADGIAARSEELAQLVTAEMGSPIGLARGLHIPAPLNSFRQAADIAAEFEFEQNVDGVTILREPYGVVAAITPWNYPLHQLALKIAYAMAAGNTVVAKPSEIAPLDAFVIAEIADSVGLPPGVFNLVTGTGPIVGEALATHPDVDVVTFTGSTQAGRRVSALASDTVKKVSLELGGKSPNVLLPDADLDRAIPAAVGSAMLNSGQTCSALTRLLVPRALLSEVEARISAVVAGFETGDPVDESTVLGPLSSRLQQNRVIRHIERAIAEGARVVIGGLTGDEASKPGAYVQATVLSDVTVDMAIHRDEVFGPVLVIEPYDSEDDAVRIANDTIYGLSAGVWSADAAQAKAIARRIRAGQVEINGAPFHPNAPFGGYKQSGNGREAGRFGFEEFLEVKALRI